MCFIQRLVEFGIRLVDGCAQCLTATCGVSELLRQMDQGRRGAKLCARLLYLFSQDGLEREMLKDCHDVSKTFVERSHIAIARFDEEPPRSVDKRMRHLVRNNVLGKTCEYRLTRQIRAWIGAISAKIPEQNRQQLGIVKRIGTEKRVRHQAKGPVSAEGNAAA